MIRVDAGVKTRQALGAAVCYGMLDVTSCGIDFTPVFCIVIRGPFPGKPALSESHKHSPMPAE